MDRRRRNRQGAQSGQLSTAIGAEAWTHRYENAQVTIANAKPGANRIVIGLMATQNIAVLFDFPRGRPGLRAANASESFAP